MFAEVNMLKKLMLVATFLALLGAAVGCGAPANSTAVSTKASTLAPTTPPINNQATIDAAVAGTQTAAAALATVTPTQSQPTLAAPLPSPTLVATEQLGQEQLATEIDQAAQDTLEATNQVYTAYGAYVVDGVLTAEEVQLMLNLLYYADDLYYQYEELVDVYYDLYGEYFDEAINALYDIEDELTMMNASLLEVETILEQGADAASAAVEELNNLYNTFSQEFVLAQQQAKDWLTTVKATLDAREMEALAVQASEIANTRLGALERAKLYGEGLRAALQDMKIAPEELEELEQLAANAVASLQAVGGAQLSALANQATTLTSLMARGQLPQLNLSLDSFLSGIPRP